MKSRLKSGNREAKPPRHLRVGIIGSIASGKTEIARFLCNSWPESEHIEELFGKNPYLADFYNNPRKYSYKSQVWFLRQKVDQLSRLKGGKTEIIDPSLEMDRIYAKTQHLMGWMGDTEWRQYQNIFAKLVAKKNLFNLDYYLVVNASYKVLVSRIEKRIQKGDRDFEKWILKRYPEYLAKLSENVKLWQLENHNLPISEIDTGYYDFLKTDIKQKLLNSINSQITLWLSKNSFRIGGVRLMDPRR